LISSKQPNGSKPEDICLACGLCCDGVIFSDVRLQTEDSFEPFATLESLSAGTKASSNQRQLVPQSGARGSFAVGKKASQVPQPCVAFDGCRCRIYNQRPKHCREFECLLLRSVRSGRTEKADALEIIRKARCRADRVWRLLRELGDRDEERSLSARFRRTAKRLEGSQLDEHTAELYGELTLAVHDLNCLLSSAFYPG
jgi:Fe-S-cluster containining protein